MIRVDESSRVSVDLGPIDVDERTSFDLRSVANLNIRLGFANETSDSRIETKRFVDVVLPRRTTHELVQVRREEEKKKKREKSELTWISESFARPTATAVDL